MCQYYFIDSSALYYVETKVFFLQNFQPLPTLRTTDEDRAFTDVLWATMDPRFVAINDDIVWEGLSVDARPVIDFADLALSCPVAGVAHPPQIKAHIWLLFLMIIGPTLYQFLLKHQMQFCFSIVPPHMHTGWKPSYGVDSLNSD